MALIKITLLEEKLDHELYGFTRIKSNEICVNLLNLCYPWSNLIHPQSR